MYHPPIAPVNGDALYRYIRHTFGDVSESKFIREVNKLGRTIRELAEAGDREAVRAWVERINNAPSVTEPAATTEPRLKRLRGARLRAVMAGLAPVPSGYVDPR